MSLNPRTVRRLLTNFSPEVGSFFHFLTHRTSTMFFASLLRIRRKVPRSKSCLSSLRSAAKTASLCCLASSGERLLSSFSTVTFFENSDLLLNSRFRFAVIDLYALCTRKVSTTTALVPSTKGGFCSRSSIVTACECSCNAS